MAYTNNTPQGNQQIATTRPLIQANFGFLNTGIGVEHNFIAAGSGSDMYHLCASMPNKALSPALPAGTNGQYFVNAATGMFYDGTTNWQLSQFETVLTGTVLIGAAFTNVAAVPANSVGFGILYISGGVAQPFSFYSDASNCYAYSSLMKLNTLPNTYAVETNNNNAALNIQGKSVATFFGTYTYKIWYRPA